MTPTRSIRVIPTTAGQALEASVEYRVPAITSDPNLANNRSALSTPVPGAQADIRTTIISDPQVARGFVPVTASVILMNTTIPGVTSVTVPEMLVDLVIAGGVADVSVPPDCHLEFIVGSQRTYACMVPELQVGIASAFDVTFTPTALDQVIRVVAIPHIPEGIADPLPDNNIGVVDVPVQPRSADLSIFSFTDTPDPSPPGEVIGYAVRMRSAPASQDALPLARLELRPRHPCRWSFRRMGRRATLPPPPTPSHSSIWPPAASCRNLEDSETPGAWSFRTMADPSSCWPTMNWCRAGWSGWRQAPLRSPGVSPWEAT